jgi:hypothetical protein
MDKKKREKSSESRKRGPAKGEALEDLELETEQALRVNGGAVSNKDKWMPVLSYPIK